MVITRVIIKNFRNLEHIEKEINGANILLLGENQKGKSNFMKAIQAALGIDAGVNPVMNGKKESSVQVVMDDNGNEYKFEVKFKEGSDKAHLTVTAPNGLKNTTKSVIGSIVGQIDFDIDAFVEMSKTEKGKKQQVEIVRSFLPEEVQKELTKHELNVKANYDDRTEINRQIKTIEGFIKESGLTPDDMKTYFLPEDVSKITEELNQAIAHNQNVSKAEQKLVEIEKENVGANKLINDYAEQIVALEKKQEALRTVIAEQVNQVQKIKDWQVKNVTIDITKLQDRSKKANEHNLKHQKVNDVRTQEMKKEEKMKESEAHTIMIETTRQLISDTIKDLDMPIEGLSFTDDFLTYNGAMVDESTLSTSEIMMLGAKLKMAKNPNAKVLFIERGESLGAAKLKNLQKMAKDHGFQVVMEQVQRGTEELVIEIMPDYDAVIA